MCCFLLTIPDLGKPARMWCEHAGRPHGGCAVHHLKATTPNLEACHIFACVWLQSQHRVNPTDRLPIELRPNRCGVMMGPVDPENDKRMFIHVDPEQPTAWKHPQIAQQIQNFLDRGATVEVIVGERHIKLEAQNDL